MNGTPLLCFGKNRSIRSNQKFSHVSKISMISIRAQSNHLDIKTIKHFPQNSVSWELYQEKNDL